MSVHEPREGAVNAAQREVLDAADGALQPFQNFLNELPLVDGGPASYVALHVGNCDDAFTLKLTGWTPLAMATGTPRFWLKSMSLCQAHAEAVLVEVETSEEEDELLELRMDNDQRHDQLRCFKLAACALAWMAGHSEFDFLSDENWHRGQLQSALPLEHVRSLEQPSLDIAVKYYASDGTIPNANLDAVDAVLVIRYIMDGNLVENPEQLRALVIFREAHPRLWFAMQFPPLKVLPSEIQTHLAEHYASPSLKVKMKSMDVAIKEIYKQEALPKIQSTLNFGKGRKSGDEDDDDDDEPPRKKAKVQEDDAKKEKKEKGSPS